MGSEGITKEQHAALDRIKDEAVEEFRKYLHGPPPRAHYELVAFVRQLVGARMIDALKATGFYKDA